jgi:excisionase family DNA binding protein
VLVYVWPVLHYAATTYLQFAITRSKRAVEREILTIGQVAAYLQVTERTFYRLSQSKKIPAFKVGGMWRYSQTDIDRWITRQSSVGLKE